jgi:putative Mg2+ transporter-C (MgtC) family protein
VAAIVLGAAIGLERERRHHPAGFRTMAMVSAGSCLFTLLGATLFQSSTDPTRIAAQVVTGVGFLGAGAILRAGGGIRGLTTAATIWVVAAIGMAAGFGAYVIAVGGTALVLGALIAMRFLRRRMLGFLLLREEDEEDEEGGRNGDGG